MITPPAHPNDRSATVPAGTDFEVVIRGKPRRLLPGKVKRWKKAEDAEKAAAKRLEVAIAAALPSGTYVRWRHGEHLREGWVIRLSSSRAEVYVESLISGKRFWTSTWGILREELGDL